MTKAPKGQTLAPAKRSTKKAAPAGAPRAPRGARPPAWLGEVQRDDRGRVASTTDNARMALAQDPVWRGVFGYDEMTGLLMVRRAPKIGEALQDYLVAPKARPLADVDLTVVQCWLQRHGMSGIGVASVHQAIEVEARRNAYHPVRDYLERLRWDGVVRLDDWLTDHLGAERSKYTAAVGRMFLVAMVARVMQPGSKADYMPILEGPQGAGKSSCCAILGGEWFSDTMPSDVSGKEASQHLRGKWLIEVGELHALSKTDATALKAFLTRQEERYRPTYSRTQVVEPRQCVFIGTTNASAYLRDETGARRFWPVKVGVEGPIQPNRLREVRDQLFAEAVMAYRSGAPWWPSAGFEREHMVTHQEERFEVDAWEEAISDLLAPALFDKPVTILSVARDALNFDASRLGTADQRRIAAILQRLGWERGSRAHGGVRRWVRRADR